MTNETKTLADATKPERMTVEEHSKYRYEKGREVGNERDSRMLVLREDYEKQKNALTKKRTAAVRRISRLDPDGGTFSISPNLDTASRRIVQSLQDEIKEAGQKLYELRPPVTQTVFDEVSKEKGYAVQESHRQHIAKALQQNDPVNAVAVEAYGIKLPEGWTERDGLLYPPTAVTPTAPAATSGDAEALAAWGV